VVFGGAKMGFLTDWLNKSVGDMDIVGNKVKDEIYFRELALYIAKSYIANAISKCEFKVFEKGAEVQNELYYALNVNPNPNQNSSQFINKIINTMYEKGDALVIKHKNCLYVADGFSKEQRALKEDIFSNITVEGEGITKSYKASEVFYFRLDDSHVAALISGLHETYGALFATAIKAFKKRNGQKYKLLLDRGATGDNAFMDQFNNVIKKQLEGFMDNDDAVYPQFKGQDLQTLPVTVQNSGDVIALRKEIFEVTAQALKIPLPMMYGNITNMNEIVKVFLTFCIDPLADMISEELTRKINTFTTWQGGKNFVRVDTRCINHIDILDMAEKADKLVSCGVFSIDEVRKVLDAQPLLTEFSQKHWITKNYSSVEGEHTGDNSEQDAQ
jgi:HK97 family phage portal protein